MSSKLSRGWLLGIFLALSLGGSNAHAQFLVDLSVDVTQSGDVYTYTYTATNSPISALGMNILLITVEHGAEISAVTGPDGWTSDYSPEESDLQVFSIAGDGITVDNQDFDILPGQSGVYTVTSLWGPGEQNYNVGKVLPPVFEFGGLIEGVIMAPSLRPDAGLACDFDASDSCDVADINLLNTAIVRGDNEISFDLTNDELVNVDDLNAFLADPAVNKLNGDLDFDGSVGFPDFLVLSNNFGKDGVFSWSDGDIASDEQVNFADFLVFSSNFGQSTSTLAAAVPEPSAMPLAMCGFLGLLAGRRGLSQFLRKSPGRVFRRA